MIRSERLWVCHLTGVSFLAGTAAGILWTLDRAPLREAPPFHGYEERLSRAFDLDPEQRLDLRTILNLYHAGVEELKVRQMGGVEPDLVKLGLTCRDRIKKWVLRPDERARFDELSGARASEPPSSP